MLYVALAAPLFAAVAAWSAAGNLDEAGHAAGFAQHQAGPASASVLPGAGIGNAVFHGCANASVLPGNTPGAKTIRTTRVTLAKRSCAYVDRAASFDGSPLAPGAGQGGAAT